MLIKYDPRLKDKATELRNNPTAAERKMWNILRMNFKQYAFTRQKPLDYFIVDFFCNKLNLIIEVDGEIHDFQKERDAERDNIFLMKYGLKTIRFKNDFVLNNTKGVIQILERTLGLRIPPLEQEGVRG